MPFYLYERKEKTDGTLLKESFEQLRKVSLARYNSIYNLWIQKGRPLDKGWHISIHDLINEITKGTGNYDTHRLIIDFDPNAKWRIGLIEIIDIYLYTYGYLTNKAIWSILMLRLREVYYKNFEKEKDIKDLSIFKRIFSIDKRREDPDQDIFEFIYLQGDDLGWNWGRVGQVNAAFIHKEAREFFKDHFCQ